jgi:hypothetical protein
MAIGRAVQKGSLVYLYDETGSQLCTIPVEITDSTDGLQGYNAATVSIRRGNRIYIYDQRGREFSIVPVPSAD